MITVLEFFGGCIFVIMRVSRITLGFGGFAQKILFMLLYFVVLPYAFLMNTRYNKNRIIEEGWLNVLKNMVICNSCNVTTLENDRNNALCDDENMNNAQMRPDCNSIFLISNTTQPSKKIGVSTLPSAIGGDNEEANFEMQQPTCSYGSDFSANDLNNCSDEGMITKATPSIATIRENLISGLLSIINDEDKYIKKLTHFIDVEEAYTCGRNIHILNHDYDHLNLDTLPHFVGSTQRKSDMRTMELQNLFDCRKDNDTYRTCFDHFVEMEENFVESGC